MKGYIGETNHSNEKCYTHKDLCVLYIYTHTHVYGGFTTIELSEHIEGY